MRTEQMKFMMLIFLKCLFSLKKINCKRICIYGVMNENGVFNNKEKIAKVQQVNKHQVL